MLLIFIGLTILLMTALAVSAVFCLRECYKRLLERAEIYAGRVRELTKSRIDVYEKAYALVFFFGGDLSPDKVELTVKDDTPISEIPALNSSIDRALSSLICVIENSETLMKERGATVKKIGSDVAELESDMLAAIISFNKQVARARFITAFKPLRRFISDIGKCPYRQISFPQ